MWLSWSGILRDSGSYDHRRKLTRENHLIETKLERLIETLDSMDGHLQTLEERKVRALALTGMEHVEPSNRRQGRNWLAILQEFHPQDLSIDQVLDRAKRTSASLNDLLAVAQGHEELLVKLPTVGPMGRETLVTRRFGIGYDPFTGRRALHRGLDFAGELGDPVFATGTGRVIGSGFDRQWGYFVRIDHGRGIHSYYAHLQEAKVKTGRNVERGDLIGTLGNSGMSLGPHLHYELTVNGRHVDPSDYIMQGRPASIGLMASSGPE